MNKNKLNKIALTLLTVAFGIGGFLAGSKERHIALVLADKKSEEVQGPIAVAQSATDKNAGLITLSAAVERKYEAPAANPQVKKTASTQVVVENIPPVNYAPAPAPTTKVS